MEVISKRYTRLEEYFPLHDFYNLKNIIITVSKEENNIISKITHRKIPSFIHFNLPLEINKIIHSFREEFIEINLKLECLPTFPYNSPIWHLQRVKHNLPHNLLEYYQYIVDITNESNIERNNWSCIYGFEKEILRFFIRINYFDFL
jgi:hypothetical protein